MDLPINPADPKIMHIDLNSCFATIEQQANPLIRNKPVVVAAYTSPKGCILAPSIEAKRFGIKTGMRVMDAKKLCPRVIVLAPDPPKYRDVHLKIRKLLNDYSPDMRPKSIDEMVLNFSGTTHYQRGLVKIGEEIKYRLRTEIGDWLKCNVGISTSRFLAKLAATLHKPDGLDVLTVDNLEETYKEINLKDLNGIGHRYEIRLNRYGIYTPYQFFHTPLDNLKKQIFKGISGYYWYLRLRGWEIDGVDFKRKTFGHSYSLPHPTDDINELARLLMKLCEKTGRRLRKNGYCAQGVHVGCVYRDHTYWHKGVSNPSRLFTTLDIFNQAYRILEQQPEPKLVGNLAVSCYQLGSYNLNQYELFGLSLQKRKRIAKATDKINDRFGEFTLVPGLMIDMENKIIDRIAFGGVKDLRADTEPTLDTFHGL